MTCSMVVQTVYGQTRCANDDVAQINVRPNDRGIRVCAFHASNPGAPQCHGADPWRPNSRCSSVAAHPTDQPMFCAACHDVRLAQEREERTLREQLERAQREFSVGILSREDFMATRIRGEFPPARGTVRDEEIVPLQPPEVVPGPIRLTPREEIRFRERSGNFPSDAIDAFRFAALDEPFEPLTEESMPSVSFSQVAIPFVAALVERLGGEVTVPARRLNRGENLELSRVSGGLRLRLMAGHEVVRTPSRQAALNEANFATSTPAPRVETKYEVEKIKDEEQFEDGRAILRCAECGMRFEKFAKKPDGTDECPYCEIRRLETVDKRAEISALNEKILSLVAEAQTQKERAARFELMVQQKIEVVNAKSFEIRDLKNRLAGRNVEEVRRNVAADEASRANAAAEESLLRDLRPTLAERRRAILRANPGASLLDLVRIVDADPAAAGYREAPAQNSIAPAIPRGGVRAAFEEVAVRFGGAVVAHRMTTQGTAPGSFAAPPIEDHEVHIRVPLRSQIS